MKVALVSPFPAEPGRVNGGVEGAALYLAEELRRAPGVSVSVVAPRREGPLSRLPATVYDAVAGRRRLHEELDRLAPDIVHFQGTTFLAAGCRRRHVLTIHGIAEKDAAWDRRAAPARALKAWLLKATEDYGRARAPHVILISRETERVLPPRPGRKLWTIPNPISEGFFHITRKPGIERALCCARLAPLKNHEGLIAGFALAAAGRPRARLRLAGAAEPERLAACRAAAERLGVADRVDFLGPLDAAELREELSRASCSVLASFQENSPLALAEAMAAGVPVAGPRAGGVPELLEDGAAGLLLDPGSRESIAEALRRLWDDEALAARLSERGREAARRRRASEVARRTLEVYREIVEGP